MRNWIIQNRLFLWLAATLLVSCHQTDDTKWEIVGISQAPDPTRTPYANAAVVCLCKDLDGNQALIAVVAFEKRKLTERFESLKVGDYIVEEVTNWENRPEKARAMYVANDFYDEFDLPLYYAIQ